MRTVAWAYAWHDGEQWRQNFGPMPGPQTVPRSEAMAILRAIQAMSQPSDLWGDCLLVVRM